MPTKLAKNALNFLSTIHYKIRPGDRDAILFTHPLVWCALIPSSIMLAFTEASFKAGLIARNVSICFSEANIQRELVPEILGYIGDSNILERNNMISKLTR